MNVLILAVCAVAAGRAGRWTSMWRVASAALLWVPVGAAASDLGSRWTRHDGESLCSVAAQHTRGGEVLFTSNGSGFSIGFGPAALDGANLRTLLVDGRPFLVSFRDLPGGFVAGELDATLVDALSSGDKLTIMWDPVGETHLSLEGAAGQLSDIQACGAAASARIAEAARVAAERERADAQAQEEQRRAAALAEQKALQARQRRQAFFRGLYIVGVALAGASAGVDDPPTGFGYTGIGERRITPADPDWKAWRDCIPNSIGPGGCDSILPGGGKSIGPGGGESILPGGGRSILPGGGQSIGPGGGQSIGPGGGRSMTRDWRCGLDPDTGRPNPSRGTGIGPCPNQ